MRRRRRGPGFGAARSVSVGNRSAFGTTLGGLVAKERRIPLVNGLILISGYDATVTLEKRSPGDFSTISTFVKTFFKLGGRLNSKRRTSQGIVQQIMRNAPGTFRITS